MKRQVLCALAATAYCTGAYAQSSVTIYGLISEGIEYVNNEGGHSNIKMLSGTLQDNRLGFRIIEDLGGGTTAIATLENGFDVTNGKFRQGGLEFGRQAWVGLTNTRYGTLTAGRQYDTFWDYLTPLVPANAGGGLAVNVGDNDNTFGTFRYNNSVKYVSPNIAGFTFEGLYALSNAAGANALNRATSFGVGYTHGPVYLTAAYIDLNDPGTLNANGAVTADYAAAPFQLFHSSPLNPNSGVHRQRSYGAGGAFTLGKFKLSLMSTLVNYQYRDQTSLHLNNYDATLAYQLTPSLSLSTSYLFTTGQYDGPISNPNMHWNTVQLSVDYFLSKRTDLYIYGDWIRASGPYAAAVIFDNAPSTTKNQVIALAGIRFKF